MLMFISLDILIEDTEDKILGEGSSFHNDYRFGKASSSQVTKELSTMVQQSAPSLLGHEPPPAAEVDETKLQLIHKIWKAANVSISPNVNVSKTNTGISKIQTIRSVSKMNTSIFTPPLVTTSSKMLSQQSEVVSVLNKIIDSKTDLKPTSPKELKPSPDNQTTSQRNISTPSKIKQTQKDVPKTAAQNQTTVSGSNQELSGTSVDKNSAMVTSKSSTTNPKFNVTKFTAPVSSNQVQKSKLGISVASQSVEGFSSKPSRTRSQDTKSPQLNGTFSTGITCNTESRPQSSKSPEHRCSTINVTNLKQDGYTFTDKNINKHICFF